MKSHVTVLAGLGLAALTITPAIAQLDIIPTFDSTITSLPNAAAVESTINSAISFYNTHITNPTTVTIDFGNINTGLGQSLSSFYTVNYSDYAANLAATVTGSKGFLASVPIQANNPVNGSLTIDATSAQLRTLGFGPSFTGYQPLPTGTFDGLIQLNTAITYTNRMPVAGEFDLFSTVQHEINEVLGLSSSLDGANNGDPAPTGSIGSMDPYRYSANGVRSFNTAANTAAYFSLDGGATSVVYFNQVQGGDFHDWASNGEPFDKAPEVQDAFGNPAASSSDFSQQPTNGIAEISALHAIGYNFTSGSAVPEPSTLAALFGMLIPGALLMRRQLRK